MLLKLQNDIICVIIPIVIPAKAGIYLYRSRIKSGMTRCMFNQDISNVFTKIGLKKTESDIYLTLLNSPQPLQVFEIAKQTKIKRSTINLILGRLLDKDYVTYHLDEARKVYSAESPTKIAFELEDLTESVKSIIPLLTTSQFGEKPSKVRFFEGKETIVNIYKDIILATTVFSHSKRQISMITSGEDLVSADIEAVNWFLKKRLENEIDLIWIAPESKMVRDLYLTTAKKERRQIKFFNEKKYPFHIHVIIYANCLALISLKGNKSGVIIENEVLSSSFQSMFNFFWDSLKS